jgi:RNA polymerase sigma-70 factor (ECF subfamily)
MSQPSRAAGHAFLQAGRAAWPSLAVDAAAFERFVAERAHALVQHAPDLYLAFACSLGDGSALRAFDPVLRDAAVGAASRLDPSAGFADEVAQVLREKLLATRPPKILGYGGRAALRTWLGISALRAAQNLRRRKEHRAGARQPLSRADPLVEGDTEREYLRARYREQFMTALQQALGSLTERERTILHLSLGEGLGVEKLGERLGVGKSTASRWLIAARERLVEQTRERLCVLLRISRSEYRSLAAIVRSQIDVSVVRLLADG